MNDTNTGRDAKEDTGVLQVEKVDFNMAKQQRVYDMESTPATKGDITRLYQILEPLREAMAAIKIQIEMMPKQPSRPCDYWNALKQAFDKHLFEENKAVEIEIAALRRLIEEHIKEHKDAQKDWRKGWLALLFEMVKWAIVMAGLGVLVYAKMKGII